VTGVEDPLGHLVARRLASCPAIDLVVGGAVTARPSIVGVQVVGLREEYDDIADLIADNGIDTIIHADRPWVHEGRGPHRARRNVIATMRLTAAAARRSAAVRSLVMASSTRVYPASSRAARLHPESEPLHPGRGSLAAILLEAEGYVRELAMTSPNLSASILRLADLAGPHSHDPLPGLLSSPIIPAVWGFDPPVQLLHVDDAAAAVVHAADHDLAGVFNVGSSELVRWRHAIRVARRPHVELPAAPATTLTRLLQRLYGAPPGADLMDELRFGRAAATEAFTRTGFRPRSPGTRCVQLLSDATPGRPDMSTSSAVSPTSPRGRSRPS
jgi:UDP-glucose 4-epimerase